MNVIYIIELETKQYNNYKNMLVKSISTLLKFYNVETLYLLTAYTNAEELESKTKDITDDLTGIIDENTTLTVVPANIAITKEINYPAFNLNAFRIDRTALLKFYIPTLIEAENVWYFDCDVLFNGNCLTTLNDSITEDTLFKIYKNKSGTNSGIIYINCGLYKTKNVINDVIQYYNKANHCIKFVDQSCFGYLVNKKYNEDCVIAESDYINKYPILDNFDKNINALYHVYGKNKANFNDIYNLIITDNIE